MIGMVGNINDNHRHIPVFKTEYVAVPFGQRLNGFVVIAVVVGGTVAVGFPLTPQQPCQIEPCQGTDFGVEHGAHITEIRRGGSGLGFGDVQIIVL